ncbi:MAG: FAD-dependent oxidoreductase [Gaiellales bacterium]
MTADFPAPHVGIVGAGLAGLAAAASALERGAAVTIYERDGEPRGATSDSAGWIWRYRDVKLARRHSPGADPLVQEAIVTQLDERLAWLWSLGAKQLSEDTGRAQTVGARVDPRQVIGALLAHVERSPRAQLLTSHPIHDARVLPDGRIELSGGEHTRAWVPHDAVVLAGGGYARDTARIEREAGVPASATAAWTVRARSGGDGSSMELGLTLGGARPVISGESLVRLAVELPEHEGVDPELLVRMSELHLAQARVRDATGMLLERDADDWSGAQLAWRLARTTGRGTLELDPHLLDTPLHAGVSVREVLDQVAAAGALVRELPNRGRSIPVHAGITHTLCGLQVDADGRVSSSEDRLELFAAGCDAAGSGLGGSASGLAQALVLGHNAGARAAMARRAQRI